MADEDQSPDNSRFDPGAGWQIRVREAPVPDWDARPAPAPPAFVPLPVFGAVSAPPAPPAPPPLEPLTAPPGPAAPASTPRSPRAAMLVAVALIVADRRWWPLSHQPKPAGGPAAEHAPAVDGRRGPFRPGPARARVSLNGGGTKRTVKLPGTPDAILETPDRSKAFLLDTSHGDVIPVNLVTGRVGAAIAVGKLPVDEEMSADGSTLYVTDNLERDRHSHQHRHRPARAGAAADPGSRLLRAVADDVGRARGRGHDRRASPASCTSTTRRPAPGSPVQVGANPAESAFYSKDGSDGLGHRARHQQPARSR